MSLSFKPKVKPPRLNPSLLNFISGILATYSETVLYNLVSLISMNSCYARSASGEPSRTRLYTGKNNQTNRGALITTDFSPSNEKDERGIFFNMERK